MDGEASFALVDAQVRGHWRGPVAADSFGAQGTVLGTPAGIHGSVTTHHLGLGAEGLAPRGAICNPGVMLWV